jgi:hypothetical protein
MGFPRSANLRQSVSTVPSPWLVWIGVAPTLNKRNRSTPVRASASICDEIPQDRADTTEEHDDLAPLPSPGFTGA